MLKTDTRVVASWQLVAMPIRRDRLRIIADILVVASTPVTKTRIMYGANLSFAQTQEVIPLLIEKGLLKKSYSHYTTTEKGKRVIESFEGLMALIDKTAI